MPIFPTLLNIMGGKKVLIDQGDIAITGHRSRPEPSTTIIAPKAIGPRWPMGTDWSAKTTNTSKGTKTSILIWLMSFISGFRQRPYPKPMAPIATRGNTVAKNPFNNALIHKYPNYPYFKVAQLYKLGRLLTLTCSQGKWANIPTRCKIIKVKTPWWLAIKLVPILFLWAYLFQ